MSNPPSNSTTSSEGADSFKDRLESMITNGFLVMSVALGNKLQLFDRLEEATGENGINSHQLAEALGLKERYVREWLASMATGSIIDFAEEQGKYYLSKVSS